MRLAARHFGNTALTVGRVAELVGYASEAAFGQAFERAHGVSPSGWRLQVPADKREDLTCDGVTGLRRPQLRFSFAAYSAPQATPSHRIGRQRCGLRERRADVQHQVSFRRHGLILTAVTGAVIALAACGGGGVARPRPAIRPSRLWARSPGWAPSHRRSTACASLDHWRQHHQDRMIPTRSYGDAFALRLIGDHDRHHRSEHRHGGVRPPAIVVQWWRAWGGERGRRAQQHPASWLARLVRSSMPIPSTPSGAALASLNGQSVEVHGTVNASNELLAGPCSLENTAGKTYPYAVVGRVNSVNTVSGTFQLVLASPERSPCLPPQA